MKHDGCQINAVLMHNCKMKYLPGARKTRGKSKFKLNFDIIYIYIYILYIINARLNNFNQNFAVDWGYIP